MTLDACWFRVTLMNDSIRMNEYPQAPFQTLMTS